VTSKKTFHDKAGRRLAPPDDRASPAMKRSTRALRRRDRLLRGKVPGAGAA
jgi:hypothetical protein